MIRHTALASAPCAATLAVMPVRTRCTRAGNAGRPRWPGRGGGPRAKVGTGSGYAELDPSTHNGAEVRRTVAWDLDVWGTVTQERGALRVGGAWDLRLRHAGKWHEIHGQLIDYGFRFYNPGLGRFINRDPLGPAGGLNPYAFLGNNPANRIEYRGLAAVYSLRKVLDGGAGLDMPTGRDWDRPWDRKPRGWEPVRFRYRRMYREGGWPVLSHHK